MTRKLPTKEWIIAGVCGLALAKWSHVLIANSVRSNS